MGKAAAARKLASAAAFGGGGLSVLGAGLYGVLRAEATLARRTIGNAGDEPPPDSTGWYGRGRPGPAIKVALLGDSSAAGYGVDRAVETPGAHLASGIAAGADRRVHLRAFAKVGAQSSDLAGQIDRALADRPRPRRDPGRRQRRDPPGAPVAVGAPPRRRRTPAPRVRRQGARRHLSRPRHGQADPAAAQAARPVVVAPARGRAGDRDGRGRRGRGLARLDPRARLRGRARAALRARPVPPVGRGLPRPGRGAGAERPQRPGLRRGASRLVVLAARARCRSPPPPSAPPRHPGTELGDKKGLWVELRRRARLRSVPEAPSDDEVVSDA